MSDFVIIEDKRGRFYHFTVNLANPVSQVLDSLVHHLDTDMSLLELSYLGKLVEHDRTFSDIGYSRLSSLTVTCPIDRVGGDRSSQVSFLESEGITPAVGNHALDLSHGDVRLALTFACFGHTQAEPESLPEPADTSESEEDLDETEVEDPEAEDAERRAWIEYEQDRLNRLESEWNFRRRRVV
jgi:hypothetical protein